MLALAFCGGVAAGLWVGGSGASYPGRTTVLTVRDTVAVVEPRERTRWRVRTDTVYLPAVSGADSVAVVLPVEQNVYCGDGYRAWVSGYGSRLDSLSFTHSTFRAAVAQPVRQKPFTVGIQAGYGITPKGFAPYIGVGVGYSIRF